MRARWVVVNDRMQQGYRYALLAPIGRDFHPDFRPDLTPAETLAFGGKYTNRLSRRIPQQLVCRPGCRRCKKTLHLTGSVSTQASRSASGQDTKVWIGDERVRIQLFVGTLGYSPSGEIKN